MAVNKRSHRLKTFIIIICVLFIAVFAVIASNRFTSTFEKLNASDKQILSELDAYFNANREKSIWSGYNLDKTPVLAVNGIFGPAYIVNPTGNINSVFAQKIEMPQGSVINVYRLSVLTPQAFKVRFSPGNFNTIGKTYSLFGNNVYFTKYTSKKSLTPKYSSEHYITFLTHEAFHYYMQKNWANGSRFSETLNDTDIDLIAREYDILSKIQTALCDGTPTQDNLIQYAEAYVSVMKSRLASNEKYVNAELSMETAEGTAEYVGIKASQIVGYDFGVMYFDNAKNVSFSDVIPALSSGEIEQSFLADRMPYESGALLCELIEALNISGWQERLNAQTEDKPVYLYTLIKDYTDSE